MSDNRLQLLIIDDDPLVIQSLKMALKDTWYVAGINSVSEINETPYHAALVDMHLSNNNNKAEGVEALKKLRAQDPHLELVAMSGDLNRELMESCLKAGATRFLAKPLNTEEVKLVLEKIEAYILLQLATSRNTHNQLRWIGNSATSQNIKKQIAALQNEDGPILIEGESGTGKEVTAQLLYNNKKNSPFISVNIAAIPENLFESEFFGHVKGAFTGAEQNKMGLSEAAHGGDLFIDEIEAMPLTQQVKLLRFLETGEVRRVGAKESLLVSTRVIAATNQNLEKLVREGKFREDLLWRLNGKKILLPPLRNRVDDIPDLLDFFVNRHKSARKVTFAPETIEYLKSYGWPGNVRELKRICEQLCINAPLPIIRKEDCQPILQPSQKSSANVSDHSIDLTIGLNQLLANYEKALIEKALSIDSDIDNTARTLQISRSSLYKKIKDYSIEVKE